MEQFIAILDVAVRTMLIESSLLEVALDYHLALTTYITLRAALRKSVQLMLTPKTAPRVIEEWDDGLAPHKQTQFES